MWTTGTSLMIARLAGSTLYANHNVASILTFDQRAASTTTTTTTGTSSVITKMRDLRARGPYALFLKDNFSEIKGKNPDLKLADVSKKVAEAWKGLSNEKKQTYTKKFEDQKLHYEEEKKRLSPKDLQSVDADEKARRIEARVKKSIQQIPTKRPRSAYAHFLTTLDRGEADIGSFVKGAAQRWAHMAVEDKQKFEDLHQQEKDEYSKALVAWASANKKETKQVTPRRSKSASGTTKTKKTSTRQPRAKSATGKRSAATTTAKKSTKSKSPRKSSDKEESSSSDDESTVKTRKSTAQKKP